MWLMAKPLPKASRSTGSPRRKGRTRKTPAGVWVIVGIAAFLVSAGLSISTFIAWKALADLKLVPGPIEAGGLKGNAAPNLPKPANSQAGVERPKSTTENAGPPPTAAPGRLEQDRVRQEVLKR